MAWKLRSHVTLGNEMKEIKMAVTDMVKIILDQLLLDRRGGRPESFLFLCSHGGGTPPPTPGPGEGGISSPYSRSIAYTTVTLLLRGAGGF
jgi:hypothetical protein